MAGASRSVDGSAGAEGHVGAAAGIRRRADPRSRGEGKGQERQKRQKIHVGVSLKEVAGAEEGERCRMW